MAELGQLYELRHKTKINIFLFGNVRFELVCCQGITMGITICLDFININTWHFKNGTYNCKYAEEVGPEDSSQKNAWRVPDCRCFTSSY